MPLGISPTGTISAGGNDGRINVNPLTPSIGVSGSNAGVDVSPSGVDVGVGGRVAGNVSGSLGVGFNPASGNIGISPRVTIGNSQAEATGSQIGGMLGSGAGMVLGGPLGAAAGSLIGSALGSATGSFFKSTPKHNDHLARNSMIGVLQDAGLINADGTATLPDGSTFNFAETGGGQNHEWTDPSKRVDAHQGRQDLFGFDTDYTNDLDYIGGMSGITLSRILSGGTSKSVDQVGSMLGNSFLGKTGYGAPLTQANFNNVMTNARAQYAKAGITSKTDLVSLANKMYADGRIKDFDYNTMLQTADMVFGNDFNKASQLMQGRWAGVDAATKTPADSEGRSGNRPGRILTSGAISPEEAFLSVQPYLDYAQAHGIGQHGSSTSTAASIASGLGIGVAGLQALAKLSGNKGIGDLISKVGNLFGIGSSGSGNGGSGVQPDTNFQLPDFSFSSPDNVTSTPSESGIDLSPGAQNPLPDYNPDPNTQSSGDFELPSWSDYVGSF